jgi:lipid II:glycine glycyltransferase (peptidoglycan interpeptide bridge formation enzyme)
VNIKGFTFIESCTIVINLKKDLDVIWKGMGNGSCRRPIKRAKKNGVEIKINENYEEFLEINDSFRKAKKLPEFSIDIDLMKKIGTLFVMKLGDEILGGIFYLNDEKNMRGLIGASKRLGVNKKKAALIASANKLLIWEAIKFGKENGMEILDFGGFSLNKNDSEKMRINTFKKGFGGELKKVYSYSKNYSKLYVILSEIKKKLDMI